MQHTFFGKRRLMITIGSCILLLAVTFTSAIGTSGDPQTTPQEKVNNPTSPLPVPLKSLFKFRILNKDWNYWSNPPNLFAIPTGNVGIGTTDPQAKLVVIEGNMTGLVVVPEDAAVVLGSQKNYFPYGTHTHYNLRLYSNQSGFASGVSVGSNYLGKAPEEGMAIQGDVGIGTRQPAAKLDVQGGNISNDGYNVCSFIGFVRQKDNLTLGSDSPWTDVPGVIINFSLHTPKYIDIRAFGSSNDQSSIGIHFVVDGIPYGNESYGDLGIYSPGYYTPWYLERIVPCTAGNHSIKLQVCTVGSSFLHWYNDEPFVARMFIQAW